MFIKQCLCLFAWFLTGVKMRAFKTMAEDLQIISKCNFTYSVDKTTLNHALFDKRFVQVSQHLKCFLHCLYYNYEWVDSNGVFDYINMKSTLSDADIDDATAEYLLSTCTDIENDDKCERAYSFTQCFWSEYSNTVPLPDDEHVYDNYNR